MDAPEEIAHSEKDIGLSFRELTPRTKQEYGFQTEQGLVVVEVKPYSEAANKGIQKGDIIIEVNKTPVSKARDLERIVNKTDSGDPIMLRVVREHNGQVVKFLVTLRIPE